MSRSRYYCSTSVLAAAMALGLSSQAIAQAAAEPAEVTEVVVTGSYIRGTPEDAAQPVDVIGAQDLQKQGSPTTVNLVKNITAAQSSIGESNRFLGTAAGAATVNLRGFGSSRTLVLFNGQRMANSPAAVAIESVDINFIPNIAIGRIEILKDGAAATYGSDAVGGVVNFITRRDLDGFEVTANYTAIDGSKGDYDVSLAHGWKFDRGDALLTTTYRRRSELRTTDRDWALRPFAENNFGGWSTASNPGVFQTGTAAQLANPQPPPLGTGGFTQSFVDNGCVELGGVLANAANPAAGCRFQFTQFDNLVNDEDHYQVFGQVNFQLADDLDFHGELLWARHTVDAERVSPAQSTTQFPTPIVASGGSPGGGTSPYPATGLNQQSRFYVPANNPGLVAFLANAANCPALGSICTNAAANGVITSQTLWRPEGYGGNPLFADGADHQRRSATAFRIGGALQGKTFADIGFNLSATYQRNHGEGGAGPDISVTRLQLALRGLGGPNCNPNTGTPGVGPCMWFNPFANAYAGSKGLGGANPFYVASANNDKPELLNWLRQSLVADTFTEIGVVEAVFNGEIPAVELPGGRIGWAVGAQWRYDRIQVNVPDFYDINAAGCVDSPPFGDGVPVCSGGTGAHTFYSAVQEIDIDRIVRSLFAEVKVPLLDNLELSGAIRYEYYGGNFGSTTNPRISARWQVTDFLAVRGSAGTTFRAPQQRDITPGFVRGLAQFNLPGVGSLYRPVLTNNNPNLKPETADTYNVGLIVNYGNFRATVDYFRFKFKNELTGETAASLVSTMFPSATESTWQCANAAFRQRFTFAADALPSDDCRPANLLQVQGNLINGPDVDTSGVDFQATYNWPEALMAGDITFGVEGTYTIEYKRGALITIDGFTIAPALDRAGKSELLSAFYSYPEWRANGYVQWNRDGHNVRWTTRFKSGTDNLVGATILKTKDEIIHDLVYTGTLPWGDVQVTAGVINIFDKDPPFTRSQYNYDYTNAYFLGRTVQLGVKKRF
jgi:iron complex outermembrane recepter protein